MFTTENLLIFAILLLLIWNGLTIIQFITLLYYKFRVPTFEIISRDEISEEVTEMVKSNEDFLYTKGFEYQFVFKHDGAIVGSDHVYYRFYYYQKEEGIHAYIETQPYRGALQSSRIIYETIYESKNICTTVDGIKYAFSVIPSSAYLFDHYLGDLEAVYQSHRKDRIIEGELIHQEVFSEEGYKAYLEYIETLYMDISKDHGYTTLSGEIYKFIPSVKLWFFSKQMVKGYKRYQKVLQEQAVNEDTHKEDDNAQIHGLMMQIDALDKARGTGNKMMLFSGSIIAFVFLFGLFGLSFVDIVILVVVLLIHELGHFFAMRYFGYTDTSIFFLPFGAAAVGKKARKDAFQEFIVYLAGPLPGIIIGIILLMSVMNGSHLNSGTLNTYAMMSIIINYLNLLPIYPLDGGKILQTLLLLRYPRIQFYFYLISLLVLILTMIWFHDYIMLIFVVLLAFAFKQNYYISKLIHKLIQKKEIETIDTKDIATVLLKDEVYKKQSLAQKANIANQSIGILHTSKPKKWLVVAGFSFYLLLLSPVLLVTASLGSITSNFNNLSKETKQELNKFHQESSQYKTLTQNDDVNYTIVSSLQELEKYTNADQVKVIKNTEHLEVNSSGLPCEVPSELSKIYNRYSHITNIIPYQNLLSQRKLNDEYQSIRKDNIESGNEDNTKAYVSVIIDDEGYGLAFKCRDEGLYNFSRYEYDSNFEKEYYSFNHFLKVTTEAYKEGAYYTDYDGLIIDQKKLVKIKRAYLSKSDEERYQQLLEYLERKSKEYVMSSEVYLQTSLLRQIGYTYDGILIQSVIPFLSSKEEEVVSSAISTLGKVGDRSVLPKLFEYVKSNNETYRNFALISISEIVDERDQKILPLVYPSLDDKSILVRLSAYRVIEKISDISAASYLIEKFDAEEHACKMSIVEILGKVKSVEALPLLEAYLKEVNEMDFTQPYKGGVRGSDPDPQFIKNALEKAIKEIKEKSI